MVTYVDCNPRKYGTKIFSMKKVTMTFKKEWNKKNRRLESTNLLGGSPVYNYE